VIGRPSEGNTIAHNTGDGVLVGGSANSFGSDIFETDRNSVRGNAIHSNGQLAIDLGEGSTDPLDDGDSVTPNDPFDEDGGANALQNFPLVDAAVPGSSTAVRGSIGSRPGATFTIDLYRTATCDTSGYGEGAEWLGSTSATTDGSGNGTWSVTVAQTVPEGEFVTATATDTFGNTSELSACRAAGPEAVVQQPPQQQPTQQTEQPQQQPQPTTPTPQGPQPDPCRDRRPPITMLRKAGVKNNKRGARLALKGTSADHRDCPSGVSKVDVSLARVAGRTGVNCRFIKRPNRLGLTRPQNCRRPVLFKATGTNRWTFTFPVRLPAGLYRVQARGTDKARNKETPNKRRNIVFFAVK
jgi:hypothetical protein